jgi:hypothetical protein
MNRQEAMQEALEKISQARSNPKTAKIISVIGSCKTTHQLESCKAWFNRIVKDEESRTLLYLTANMRFGQIDCGIDI